MSDDEYKLVDEQIGLWGAVALLAGTALGMSIFVVPTQMAAVAGPSITLAILVAIVPMALGVLLLLQLGGAIPVAGGVYVYGSRLVGPYWGLVSVAIPVLAIWSYLLFAAIGFSQYLAVFVDVPATAAIWGILGLFLLLNYAGVKIVTRVQIGLVFVLFAGMVTFILGGAFAADPANFTPVFPPSLFDEGLTPFLLAVVLLYIPFQGFGMIIEIGEELEDPVQNIPRVLAIGMGIVTLLSLGVVFALVGAVPWQQVIDPATGEAYEGGLAAVAGGFLPEPAILVIAVGAMVAAATTINTLFTSYSRTVMRAARDEVIPEYFAAVHDDYGTPHRAISLLAIPPLVAAPFVDVFESLLAVALLDWLVVVVVSGIFVAFMIAGVALWNLPRVFPKRYEHSIYRLPVRVVRVVAVGNVVVSVVFAGFVALSAPSAMVFVLGWIALVTLAYRYRLWVYEREGVDLKARMALLHKHEQVGSDE
jgi:APA family basic amino acid/polyamine antiporter